MTQKIEIWAVLGKTQEAIWTAEVLVKRSENTPFAEKSAQLLERLPSGESKQ